MNTSCSDFLIDVIAHRLTWLRRQDLIEIAVRAGFQEKSVRLHIHRCWRTGLLYRGVRNIAPIQDEACWYDSRKVAPIDDQISQFVKRDAIQRKCISQATELISMGPLAAGLLGLARPIEPESKMLEAHIRLAGAFMHHLARGLGPESWRLIYSRRFLANRAVVAARSSNDGTVKEMVVSCASANRKKLKKLLCDLDQMEVNYEIW